MKSVTFITGNQNKADYLARYLGHPIDHLKLDLDEIQSLDLREVVEHKVRQAYDQVQGPVLVEDISLEFVALGRLPGTFIRWFVDEMDFADICSLLNGKDRSAIARCIYGYYDGTVITFVEGSMKGKIAEKPADGSIGWDWDKFFIPEGYDVVRTQLSEEEYQKTYVKIKGLEELKAFLTS